MTRGGWREAHQIGLDGLVVLRLRDGDVRIRGIEGDTATVRTSDADDATSLSVERGTASLTITAGNGTATPDLDLEIPVRATVLVEASSSDIRAEGLLGQQRYQTTSGDIQVRDVAGDLSVEAVSGDLEITAVAAASIAARTVSGDLEIRATALAALRASTTSGDLTIDAAFVADGPYTLETVSGDAGLISRGPLRVETTTLTGSTSGAGDVVAEGRDNARIFVAGSGGPTVRFRSTSGDFHLDARSAGPAATSDPTDDDRADDPALGVLQALERGEIDTFEAARRLDAQEASRA